MINVKNRNKGRQKYDEINEIFYASSCTVIPSEYERIHSYRLEYLDEDTKYYLRNKMEQAIASPRDTYLDELHKLGIEGEWNAEEMADVLDERVYSSLLTLALLGNTDVLTRLLPYILERIKDKEGIEVDYKILRESLFILRLLIGQEASVGHISIDQRLKQNLPTLQQIPLDTRLRLGDLADWQIILENSRKRIEALTEYAKSNEKSNFELDNKIWQLWDDLERWVPRLEFEPLWCFPLLNQKVALSATSLLKQIQNSFTLPDPQNIEIWYDVADYLDPSEALWPYWEYVYPSLESEWQLSSRATLESVRWEVNRTMIGKFTKWQIPIHSIERLNIKGAVDTFWIVTFQDKELAEMSAISNALLLNLQLIAQQGGNILRPVEVDNGKLVVELQIPRADSNEFANPPGPMPEGVIEQVTRHILASILPDYMKISHLLEEKLFEAISRIEPYIPLFDVPKAAKRSSLEGFHTDNIEQQLFYELQEATNEVVSLREILAKHLDVLSN